MGLVNRILQVLGPNMATNQIVANPITTTTVAGNVASAMSPNEFIDSHKKMWSRQNGRELVFRGMVEVEQTCNGYLITISTGNDKPGMSYIANSLQEVNDIITAQMVCFKLEGKE